jgi:hypothetical protein
VLRRPPLALALVLAAAAAGCAPRLAGGGGDGRPRVERFTAGGAAFRLVYLDEDSAVAEQLKQVLAEVAPAAQRWGALQAPVTITVHPSHEALEAAVQREGFEWLRAWARYASIDLQSPRSWSFLGPSREQIAELVLHELTHCAMYQNAGSEWSWPYKGIPLWFREGLASVNAGQGHRRPGPDRIARFYQGALPAAPGSGGGGGGNGAPRGRARADGDPLTDPEPLYQDDSELVYGTAHLAFEFLVRRYGEERVRAVLDHMGRGEFFGPAFRRAIGLAPEEFEREFRRYLIWEGWRGAG